MGVLEQGGSVQNRSAAVAWPGGSCVVGRAAASPHHQGTPGNCLAIAALVGGLPEVVQWHDTRTWRVVMTNHERRLLSEVKAAEHWFHRPPVLYTAYLVPTVVTAVCLSLWLLLASEYEYQLVAQAHDAVYRVEVDVRLVVACVILIVGMLALAGAHLSVCRWSDRRLYGRILEQVGASLGLMKSPVHRSGVPAAVQTAMQEQTR